MVKHNFRKAVFTIVSVFMLLSVLCTSAFAADQVKNYGLKYGEIVPTNSKLSAQVKSYSFYGDSGLLYFMRISKGKKNANYAVEIYADSQYKNKIRSHTGKYDDEIGNKPISVTWNFKDLKSGTYYGKCYTYVQDGEDKITDTSSLKTFKINIDRLGKRKVSLTKISNTATGPKISWKKVPTATAYEVYRKASGDKSWKLIFTAGEKATSYTDTSAKSGKKYYYTVKCTDGKKYKSLYDTKGLSIYYLAQPKLKDTAGSTSAGYAKVTWSKVSGAQGYYVYRKGGSLSNYEWEKIATIKNGKTTSYTDKKAKSSDWNYTYTVRAYYSKTTSSYDETGLDFDYIAAPKIKDVNPHCDGLEITWSNSNENVVKYYIYRKSGSSWKKVGSTTKKSFIDETAKSGKKYTYTVAGVSDTNVGAYSNSGKSETFVDAPKLKSIGFDDKDRGVFRWYPVSGASSYKIYRKTDNDKSWKHIATVKGQKSAVYYDTVKKESGQKFKYTIKALDKNNNTSAYYTSGISSIYLAKPVFTAVQQDNELKTTAIELNWKKINGASYYMVYRKTSDSAWTCIADNIEALTYTDATAENGVAYEYMVRACNNKGNISKYNVKSATAVNIPVISEVSLNEDGVSVYWSAVENATYNIYRAPYDTDEWVLVGTSAEPAFTDTFGDAKFGNFSYTVTAVLNNTESVKSSAVSNTAEISATAELVTEYNEDTHITETFIKLTWSANNEDAAVSISKVTDDGEPVDLGTFTAIITNEYADYNTEPGKTYTYTLTAQAPNKVEFKTVVSLKRPLPPLESTQIIDISGSYNEGEASCTFTWFPVEFASEYIVLRGESTENLEEFEQIASVPAENISEDEIYTYTDQIDTDTVYSYIIKAVSIEEREASVSPIEYFCVYAPLTSLSDLKAVGDIGEDEFGDKAIYVTLTWAPTEYVEKYIIERKTDDGEYEELAVIIPDDEGNLPTAYIDKTGAENTQYTYRVTAANEIRGSVSNEIGYAWITGQLTVDN